MAKRETARERDLRLIAEAGPWRGAAVSQKFLALMPDETSMVQPAAAVSALLRETDRIAREWRAGEGR